MYVVCKSALWLSIDLQDRARVDQFCWLPTYYPEV